MSAVVHGIEHEHDVGARVEVRSPLTGTWVAATVVRHEPYIRRGFAVAGYYVSYPGATEQWHCHGGWHHANAVRRPQS